MPAALIAATGSASAVARAPGRWTWDLRQGAFGGRWWRGLATLLLLVAAALQLGLRIAPITDPLRPAMGAAARAELDALGTAPLALGAAGAATTAPTLAVERLAEPPERPSVEATARLMRAGDVAGALRAGGLGAEEAAAVAAMAARETAVAALPAGTLFEMTLGRRETKAVPRPLTRLLFRAAFDLKLRIARGADGALALTRLPIAIDRAPLRIEGRVGSGLARAVRGAGAPAAAIGEFTRQLGYRVDLARGVRSRDRFELLLAHERAATGETRTGALLYARLARADGQPIELLRWTHDGRPGFFLASGEAARRGLIATPVEGAHITSGFGLRFHPILGFSRMHQGMDFGAASGAPIVAAAAGRVAFAGWHGGHGNYVRVSHRPGLETAYGHMSRIAVRPGQAVPQGAVIGYVGSTGISTGPHLHYEVWMGGRAVDPRAARLPTGVRLAGAELARFQRALAGARAGRAVDGA